jgi:NAD(P)-dependent dehydrogenase (short-subunit alcohol dehydrogenase family)
MFSLKEKVVVLFGGNGYLGKNFCETLLENDCILYNCDINESDDEMLDSLKEQYQDKYITRVLDAGNQEQLISLREEILENHGRVDVLINSTTSKGNDFYLPFEEVSLEGWEIGMKGNLTVPFLTIQAFIPVMRKQKYGSIINISSIYGIVGNDQSIYEGSNLHEIYVKESPNIKQIYSHGVYNASKGGLTNFTRYLAAYYGKYNVRVNTITPGGIYYPNENETFLNKYSAKVPLGRKANSDEVNGALVFLASDASSYITGHNLVVDGGFSIW